MASRVDHRQRSRGVLSTAGLAAALVAGQHLLAAGTEFTTWGPYGAGGEELPPLDIARSAWLMGAGAAVVSWIAVALSWVTPRSAALVVALAAGSAGGALLVLQGVPLSGFDGGLSWGELLVPHAVLVAVGSVTGAWTARAGVGYLLVLPWAVGAVFLAGSAVERATHIGSTLSEIVSAASLLVVLSAPALTARARRRGAGRPVVLNALAAAALLPVVAFTVARGLLLPDFGGFEVDDAHASALVLGASLFVLGAVGALGTVNRRRAPL